MAFEINERILEIRKTLKLSQTEFGKRIGVSRGVMNNIDLSIVEAKPLLIDQIVKNYNVNRVWLETGEGEMFVPLDEESELAMIFGQALSPDCSPERRRVIKAIMALLEEVPDDLLPVIGKHFRSLADACENTKDPGE